MSKYFTFLELIKTDTGLNNVPIQMEHVENLICLCDLLFQKSQYRKVFRFSISHYVETKSRCCVTPQKNERIFFYIIYCCKFVPMIKLLTKILKAVWLLIGIIL